MACSWIKLEIRPKILEGGGQGRQRVAEGSFAVLRTEFTREKGPWWDGQGGAGMSAAGMETAVNLVPVRGERKALSRQTPLTERLPFPVLYKVASLLTGRPQPSCCNAALALAPAHDSHPFSAQVSARTASRASPPDIPASKSCSLTPALMPASPPVGPLGQQAGWPGRHPLPPGLCGHCA